ncbi:MAG: hydantoinase B/oxoprolinase family protein [Armatimonadetes bacterium]|nr:hydantoinase B/oxoprolinase family protein [Armatimonadota bacterium]
MTTIPALHAVLREAAARLAGAGPSFMAPTIGYVPADGMCLAASDGRRPASLGICARAVLDFFAGDWRDGDAAVTNDPFCGGVHVGEFTLVRSAAGGAVAVRARLPDVGGAEAGGIAPAAFDTWGEGARFVPLRIAVGGMPRREALDLLALNTRTPRLLRRLLDAMRGEADRVAIVLGDRAPERTSLEQAREAARDALARVRPGEYAAEARVERPAAGHPVGGGADAGQPAGRPGPAVRLALTLARGGATLDFSASDPQEESPLNSTPAHTLDCALSALAGTLPGFPCHAGALPVVAVKAGEGTIASATLPAMTALSPWLTARAIRRAIGGCLAQAGLRTDPDGWWSAEGAASYGAMVDPAMLRLRPELVAEARALEEGLRRAEP